MNRRESVSEDPFSDAWANTSVLKEDDLLRHHVEERFKTKYLKAVLSARNDEGESRAWHGFYYWLTVPSTSRKPFQIPEEDADKIIDSLRSTVFNLRNSNKRMKEKNVK